MSGEQRRATIARVLLEQECFGPFYGHDLVRKGDRERAEQVAEIVAAALLAPERGAEPGVLLDLANWSRVTEYVEQQGYMLVPRGTTTTATSVPTPDAGPEPSPGDAQEKPIYGFYEEEYPIYSHQWSNELQSPVSADEVNGLVAEIRRLRAEREWRPIETAPKDGTRVLLWSKWDACAMTGAYLYRNAGVGHEGWYATGTSVAPSHWMPLPEPPVVRARTEGERSNTREESKP